MKPFLYQNLNIGMLLDWILVEKQEEVPYFR